MDQPKIAFRLDAKGQPLTKIPVASSTGGKGGGPASRDPVALPDIVTKNGELTLQQEGPDADDYHQESTAPASAPVEDGGKLTVKTDDPAWGQG